MGGDCRRNAPKRSLIAPDFCETSRSEPGAKLGSTGITAVDIDFKLCFRAALVVKGTSVINVQAKSGCLKVE